MEKLELKKAKKFLDKINSKDNILIICHDDLDGMASGVLFYDYCIKKSSKNVKIKKTNYNSKNLEKINLDKITKILIADLGPELIYPLIERVQEDVEIFYTDHHQKSKIKKPRRKFLELRTIDQGYIPSSRTVFELCGGKEWLSIMGVLSDFGEKYQENNAFLNKFYLKEKTDEMEMVKKMMKISKTILFFEKNKKLNFLEELKKIETMEQLKKFDKYERPVSKEIETKIKKFEKNHEKLGEIIFYEIDSKYNIKSFLISNLSIKYSDKILVFINRTNSKKLGISARNHSKEYNVIKILKDNIVNGSAGGHKAAAGGEMPLSELKTFKRNLSKYNIGNARIK